MRTFGFAGLISLCEARQSTPLSNKKGIVGNRWQAVANIRFTMRSETLAVGCQPLPIGLFEPFSTPLHLRPVATGCARWAP